MDLLQQIAADAAAAKPAAVTMEEVIALVQEGAELEETIESLNEALKAQVGRYNRIKQKLLPDAMKSAGLGNFTTEDGRVKVKKENYVSGSLPKEEHDKVFALEYLAEIGGADLIKNQLSVDFSKGEDNAAKAIYALVAEQLKEMKIEVEPTLKESVHAQSLQAFGRQLLRAGHNFQPEKLGLAVGDHCKFEFYDEHGKKKKKKATEE
jgi:hypothetical protein